MPGTWGIIAAADIDIDNDGDLDLYFSRGEYYFTVADQNSVDFHAASNRLDMRVSGSQGTLPFEINASGSITISGFDHVNRNGYTGGFPLFLGSTLQEETLADINASLEITPVMADGWPATPYGKWAVYRACGQWRLEGGVGTQCRYLLVYSLFNGWPERIYPNGMDTQ